MVCKNLSALFWDIRVVIVYRRFGTTCRSHLLGSRVRVGKMGPKRRKTITTRRHVISQKTADVVNIAAEAWNECKKSRLQYCELDSSATEWRQLVGFCEHGNEMPENVAEDSSEIIFSCAQIANDKRKDGARRRPAQTFIGRETGSESGNSTWGWSKWVSFMASFVSKISLSRL
jgi:hypothetical protein